MTTRTRTDGAPDLFKVVGTAAWLNFEGAARTVIRGRRGWVGGGQYRLRSLGSTDGGPAACGVSTPS